MKTLLIDHPTNRNLKLEIDVPPDYYEEEQEIEFVGAKRTTSQKGNGGGNVIGGGGGGNNNNKPKKEYKSLKKPNNDGGGVSSPPPVVVKAEPVDDDNCLHLVIELDDFVRMVADALSIQKYSVLLKDPSKTWNEQVLPTNLCTSILKDVELNGVVSDENWKDIAREVIPDVYGGMLRSYNALTSCVAQGITLRQLVESTVTSAKFAELVAAVTRQGAGGSAQPGRFYGSTYKNTPSRMSYNVHAGLKFQERNAKQIAYLKLWFTAIKLYDKVLTYTQPDIPKSKYGFY